MTGVPSNAHSTMASSSISSLSPSNCNGSTGWRTVIRRPRRALLDEMASNVHQALDEATRLAQSIYPPLLETGFASALRSAAHSAGVTAVVDVPAAPDSPREISAALYWTWSTHCCPRHLGPRPRSACARRMTS